MQFVTHRMNIILTSYLLCLPHRAVMDFFFWKNSKVPNRARNLWQCQLATAVSNAEGILWPTWRTRTPTVNSLQLLCPLTALSWVNAVQRHGQEQWPLKQVGTPPYPSSCVLTEWPRAFYSTLYGDISTSCNRPLIPTLIPIMIFIMWVLSVWGTCASPAIRSTSGTIYTTNFLCICSNLKPNSKK